MLQPELCLRPAAWDDLRQVWRWNNGPDVRRWSMRVESIPFEDHEQWFRARLDDPEHRLWIAHVDGRDIGVVRIDGAGVVSIALAEDARGQGWGTRALGLACQFEGRTLEAWIAEDNAASIHCFERCGFEARGEELHGARTFVKYERAAPELPPPRLGAPL